MGNTVSHSWDTLSAAPFGDRYCARTPVLIGDEIIVSRDNHIWKFNTVSNQWTKHMFGNYKNISDHAMCVSNDGQKIFIFDGGYHKILLIIDIQTMKTIKEMKHKIETGIDPSMICDPNNDDLLHIIGGYRNNKHITLNTKNGETQTIHAFKHNLRGAGIVFIKSKNEFILFHGKIPIQTYDLRSEKWRNTNIKMPKNERVSNFGYVLTKNEKYVIIIGGYNCKTSDKTSDKILIYDITHAKYVNCPIKAPKEFYDSNAVLTNNGNIHFFQKNKHFQRNINQILTDNDDLKIETNENKSEISQFETEQKRTQNQNEWICDVCTYKNSNNTTKCEICDSKNKKKTERFERKEIEQKQTELKSENEKQKQNLERLELERFQRIKIEKEKTEIEQKLNELQNQFKNEQSKELNKKEQKEMEQRLTQMQTQLQNMQNKMIAKNEKINHKNDNICENLLREWNLSQYTNVLITENGYEDIEDWIDLSLDDLEKMGFKPGHSRKFKRKTNEYFNRLQKQKVHIQNDNDNEDNGLSDAEGAEGYDGTVYM